MQNQTIRVRDNIPLQGCACSLLSPYHPLIVSLAHLVHCRNRYRLEIIAAPVGYLLVEAPFTGRMLLLEVGFLVGRFLLKKVEVHSENPLEGRRGFVWNCVSFFVICPSTGVDSQCSSKVTPDSPPTASFSSSVGTHSSAIRFLQ